MNQPPPIATTRQYELIDFGNGRKLESFGGRLVDRPSPAAAGQRKRLPKRWNDAHSRFDAQRKQWEHHVPWPVNDFIDCGVFQMPIAPTPFGHVGVFPEQRDNWNWIHETSPYDATKVSGLNLFAYTGASSIAMAMSGMKVAHVDAAKPNVTGARAAAELNGLENHPIRYLVDDAAKFAAREVRRGNRYHTIVLDPPAYGHSPNGKTWRLERDLWALLDDCMSLLSRDSHRLLITGHSPQIGPREVVNYIQQNAAVAPSISGKDQHSCDQHSRIVSGRLTVGDASGRQLDAGFFVRWIGTSNDQGARTRNE